MLCGRSCDFSVSYHCVVGMVGLGCAVYFGMICHVNGAVSVDADHKARGWAAYFIEHMPKIDALKSHRQP